MVAGLQEGHRNVLLLKVNPGGLIVLTHLQRVVGLGQHCPPARKVQVPSDLRIEILVNIESPPLKVVMCVKIRNKQ